VKFVIVRAGGPLPAVLAGRSRRARECLLFLAGHPDSSNRETAAGIGVAHEPQISKVLRSLAEGQLQTQVSRSGTLDAGALGVVSACTAVAAIVLGIRSAHHLWIAALILLVLSLGLAVRALRLPGAEQTGPLVAEILEARRANDDDTIEEQLLDDLAHETFANENALARKDPLMTSAVTCLILGIVVELAAQVLP
jgi:hypothetical protein